MESQTLAPPSLSPTKRQFANVTHPRRTMALSSGNSQSPRAGRRFQGGASLTPMKPGFPRSHSYPSPPISSVAAQFPIWARGEMPLSYSMSYILPLMDGATGTIPLSHQHSTMSLLRADAPYFLQAVPRLVLAQISSLTKSRREMSGGEIREIGTYLLLSAVEIQLVVFGFVLWLTFPGLLFLLWLSANVGLIWSLINVVNRESRTFTCEWNGRLEGDENRGPHEWLVVGGMEWSEYRLRTHTIPRLAKLFASDMQSLLPYRLGIPFDLLACFIQRNLQLPTPTSTALYNHIRANCVKARPKTMHIIVHNTGALDMAWALSRLFADLPAEKLNKVHVYTFGAASAEMTMPLGRHSTRNDELDSCPEDPFLQNPQISHYAFENDPYAEIGVLMGARQRMEGRLVGAVYAIQDHAAFVGFQSWLPRSAKFTLDDYLDVLFPNEDPRAGVLGQVCRVEREVSEMRELAALAKAVQAQKRRGKRLSWTALGMMADKSKGSGIRNDRFDMAGIESLEEARRRGRASEGMLGYENSVLAGLVSGPYRLEKDEIRENARKKDVGSDDQDRRPQIPQMVAALGGRIMVHG